VAAVAALAVAALAATALAATGHTIPTRFLFRWKHIIHLLFGKPVSEKAIGFGFGGWFGDGFGW